jgi:predicted aldo/keto reductase-like oxidoreductase
MNLKDFGKRSGLKISPVSIGGMRLPTDTCDAVAIIRYAIDNGVRYIDTSRGYGDSELIFGLALQDGYREKVYLSTKASPWITKIGDAENQTAESVVTRIKEQLLRLNTDYLDFYQIWSVFNKENWELALKPGGVLDGMKEAKKQGLVKHLGFTTHQAPDELLNCLDEVDWCEVILISYNLLQKDYTKCLKKAHNLGIGTIVMNPVGGGKFAEESPVLSKLAEQVGANSVADMAVRYVFSNPNVDTILCGINKKSDIDADIAAAEKGPFSDEAIQIIDDFFNSMTRKKLSFCTSCGYCQPCPHRINIPEVMSAIYEERFLGLKEGAKNHYNLHTRDVSPSVCTKCGICEKKCTQHLKIISELEYAVKTFS